ncbi:class I SAM-dependent methyltransferase [Actibacterium sp. 188UL27-1]|uniref:class I SAM-dependent methyltransferase n=1 Tax=Actibacterium sp. 188UL27-1 TaxID=2786961 RepID=UPI0019577AD4|nr:class I SAM-dependent methyltransferase [Actibacterium sp. 188UL27-1]MBM7069691.1 class I SAM-dependent methyltransferase [Actibacterium sp. 188UL27-1]
MLTIRRDDGHIDTHGPGIYFAPDPFAHEASLLQDVEGPVLDVGSGAGRTLLWLDRKGVEAVGVDLSPGAVNVAQDRGCRDVRLGDVMDPKGKILGDDMFQTVVVFGNNMGIGGTYEGAEALLHRLACAVMPSGQALVTGLDIAQTNQPHHLAYHRRNLDKGRPRGEIKMRFEYQGATGEWVRWFHPEPDELARLARSAGWTVERIGPAGGPFYAGVLRNAR